LVAILEPFPEGGVGIGLFATLAYPGLIIQSFDSATPLPSLLCFRFNYKERPFLDLYSHHDISVHFWTVFKIEYHWMKIVQSYFNMQYFFMNINLRSDVELFIIECTEILQLKHHRDSREAARGEGHKRIGFRNQIF
jgi:hypothetical protein